MDPDSYDDFLQPLPADRRDAVKAWLGGTLKDCAACEQPIRVMDSHRLVKDALVHTACAPSDA
ncbi:unannotated protein [freshwater metagenome]|uniref:Unannotated protein n=1 Tax=freshwater metagenome TaxID=449393 RepID=A0A6J7JB44_9ZZZZ|nr:hypothetical protein [Actinomycetota bacterium]